MSRIASLKRTPTLALRQRKAHLLRSFELPPHLLHASLIERFLKCGKANCHCHSGGPRHGPFFYLNRCFGPGRVQSLLLKSPEQIEQARQVRALTRRRWRCWISLAKSIANCSAEAPLVAADS